MKILSLSSFKTSKESPIPLQFDLKKRTIWNLSCFKSFGPSFFMFPGLSLDCSCQDATAGEAAGGGQEEHQSTKE